MRRIRKIKGFLQKGGIDNATILGVPEVTEVTVNDTSDMEDTNQIDGLVMDMKMCLQMSKYNDDERN